MNRLERLFALREVSPFSHLYDSELAAIAEVASVRRFEPGAVVLHEGQEVRHLFLAIDGELVDGRGRALPRVYGAAPVVLGHRANDEVLAHPAEGVTCLLIARPHLLTIVDELPALLLQMQTEPRSGSEERS